MINQGQHIMNYWEWLFGSPQAVFANIPFGKYNNFQVDDEATIIMEYPNKVTGLFVLTTGEIQREERLCIIGSKGKISMYGNRIVIEKNGMDSLEYGRTAEVISRNGMNTTSESIMCEAPEEAYDKMLNNFSEAILDGVDLISTGQDGVKTLEITNAAYMSAWLNRKITLPIDEIAYEKLLNEHIENEKRGI